jgi:ribosomal protein S6
MTRYETLILTVPEITSDETSLIETQFQKLINSHRGSLISFERWGKMQLAYPVRNHEYGVYFLIRYEVSVEESQELLKEARALLAIKHSDTVMRNLTSKLDPHAPLTYQRPETLEDIPGKMTDELIKEHKISV